MVGKARGNTGNTRHGAFYGKIRTTRANTVLNIVGTEPVVTGCGRSNEEVASVTELAGVSMGPLQGAQ